MDNKGRDDRPPLISGTPIPAATPNAAKFDVATGSFRASFSVSRTTRVLPPLVVSDLVRTERVDPEAARHRGDPVHVILLDDILVVRDLNIRRLG